LLFYLQMWFQKFVMIAMLSVVVTTFSYLYVSVFFSKKNIFFSIKFYILVFCWYFLTGSAVSGSRVSGNNKNAGYADQIIIISKVIRCAWKRPNHNGWIKSSPNHNRASTETILLIFFLLFFLQRTNPYYQVIYILFML